MTVRGVTDSENNQTEVRRAGRRVRTVHSYETPEIMAVPVVECSGPYLEWLISAVETTGEAVASPSRTQAD
jgi:uncharacterized protein involved in tolerance to divalent cations